MSARYIFVYTIFNFFAVTIFASDIPKVPPAYERFLEYDQKFNSRKLVNSEIIPIYAYDLPRSSDRITALAKSEIENRQSLLALGIIDQQVNPTKRRVFTLEQNRQLGNPTKIYSGTKMTSTSSYFVWNQDSSESLPFIVKFKKYGNINGLIISTLLKRHLNESEISFIPEVGFTQWQKSYGKLVSNTIRTTDFMKSSPNPEFFNYPLHGFLGAGLFSKLAKYSGYFNDNNWFENVYAVKLGKWMATLNFKYGLFPASHTQNLVLQFNRLTGNPTKLILKDLSDVSIDRFLWENQMESASPLLATFFANLGAQINSVNHDSGSKQFTHPGDYLAAYFGQSLIQANQNASVAEKIRITSSFLKSYIEEVEKIMEIDLKNDPKVIDGITKQNNLDKISFTVLAIYNSVIKSLLPTIDELSFPQEQTALRKSFLREVKYYNASYFNHKTSKKIRKGRTANIIFAAQNAGIYAVDKTTNAILALAHLNHYPWDEVNIPKQRAGLKRKITKITRKCINLLSE